MIFSELEIIDLEVGDYVETINLKGFVIDWGETNKFTGIIDEGLWFFITINDESLGSVQVTELDDPDFVDYIPRFINELQCL